MSMTEDACIPERPSDEFDEGFEYLSEHFSIP